MVAAANAAQTTDNSALQQSQYAAFKLVLIASDPNWAPTTLERISSSSSFNPPIRMVEARFLASLFYCRYG